MQPKAAANQHLTNCHIAAVCHEHMLMGQPRSEAAQVAPQVHCH